MLFCSVCKHHKFFSTLPTCEAARKTFPTRMSFDLAAAIVVIFNNPSKMATGGSSMVVISTFARNEFQLRDITRRLRFSTPTFLPISILQLKKAPGMLIQISRSHLCFDIMRRKKTENFIINSKPGELQLDDLICARIHAFSRSLQKEDIRYFRIGCLPANIAEDN